MVEGSMCFLLKKTIPTGLRVETFFSKSWNDVSWHDIAKQRYYNRT